MDIKKAVISLDSMSSLIKSPSSLIGVIIFLGIAVYSTYQGGFNMRAILAYVITIYFLVAAVLGVRSRTTMLVRIVIISIFVIYMISVYVA